MKKEGKVIERDYVGGDGALMSCPFRRSCELVFGFLMEWC